MRVSISAQFTIKDRPEGYLGLTGEHWNFGKDEALSLSDMCGAVLFRILWYYGLWMTPEEMKAEIDEVAELLLASEFHYEGEDEQEKV